MPSFKDIALYGTIGAFTAASASLALGLTLCSGAEAASRFAAVDPELTQFCAQRASQMEIAAMAASAISPIVSVSAHFCNSNEFIRRVTRYMGVSAAALPMSLVYQSLSPGSLTKKFPLSIYDCCKASVGLVSACVHSIMEKESKDYVSLTEEED